ncbi:hypothetical protein [Radiobacillus sp. PE A8.2]|uniref:hypothetical protein n=1 Tax=Radiobacillus sp. PE A8.2 TaxID=3380349 RepID=UPI00388EA5BB
MKKRIVIIFAISNLLWLISPLFFHTRVENFEDLENAGFGFPFPFLKQNLSYYNPPFPHEMSLTSPLESPVSIHIGYFLASVLVVNSIVFLILKMPSFLKRV